MLKFECSECGASREVPDNRAGQRVRCQECKVVGRVPAAPIPLAVWLAGGGLLACLLLGLAGAGVAGAVYYQRRAPAANKTAEKPVEASAEVQARQKWEDECRAMTRPQAEECLAAIIRAYPPAGDENVNFRRKEYRRHVRCLVHYHHGLEERLPNQLLADLVQYREYDGR